VGVAVHDDLGVGERLAQGLRVGETELITVGHRHQEAIQLKLGHLRAALSDLEPVHVAVHRGHRRQGLELGEHIRRANVAAVQDVIDLREDIEHLRA
jgi:hypothetical protein